MTTEERFIQPDDSPSDDEVARLVRLAGTSRFDRPDRRRTARACAHGGPRRVAR